MKKEPLYSIGDIVSFKLESKLYNGEIKKIRLIRTKNNEFFEYGVKVKNNKNLLYVKERAIVACSPNLYKKEIDKGYDTFVISKEKAVLYSEVMSGYDRFFTESSLDEASKEVVFKAVKLVDSVRSKLELSGYLDMEFSEERFDLEAALNALLYCPRYFFDISIARLEVLDRKLNQSDNEKTETINIDNQTEKILKEYDKYVAKKVNSACLDYDRNEVAAEVLASNEYISGLYCDISEGFNKHVGAIMPKRRDYTDYELFKRDFAGVINESRYKKNLILNHGKKIDWSGVFPLIGENTKYIPKLNEMPIDLVTYKSEIEKEFVNSRNFLSAVTKVNKKYSISDDVKKTPCFLFYYNEVYRMNQMLLEESSNIGNVIREENNCKVSFNYEFEGKFKGLLIDQCNQFGGKYDFEKDCYNIPNECMARRFVHLAENKILEDDFPFLKTNKERQNLLDDYKFAKNKEIRRDDIRRGFKI